MQSKVSAVAARAVESSCLAALVVVPVFFDPHTERTFDADKILLLRSIALVISVGLIIWTIEVGRRAYTLAGRPIWRAPVVAPMLLLTAAYGVSTLFGIAPRISFWGGYFRCQGTYTWLSYVSIFAAIVLLARRREQIERPVTMALLASVPPTIYGLMQHLGRDPIDWPLSEAAASRIIGTAGNPIFLSGFMIMIVPLTLARAIERWAAVFEKTPAGEPPRRRFHSTCLATSYLVLLAMQVLTIVYSQSRGPFIGLAAGLIVFFLVGAAQYRTRWMTLTMTGVAALSILFLVVFVLPNSRLGRLGGIKSQMEEGTGKVRALIWQGAIDLLAAQPLRTLIGYGPDAMALAYEPFYPPELAHYEGRIVTPDRAHNETFDALIMTGVVGCAAQLALFGAIFYAILNWLGMVKTAVQRNVVAATMGLGGVIGGVTPYVVDGGIRFSGVGLPAGVVAGVIVYLVVRVMLGDDERKGTERRSGLILAGLLAAIIAHFVEIQVGIATASTRLYFAAFAGLAVAIGAGLSGDGDAGVRRSPGWRGRTLPTGSALLHGAIVGLILILLTYEFSVPSLRPGAPGFVLLWLFVGTWVYGLILLTADSSPPHTAPRHWLADSCGYTVISLALWLLFAAIHVAWIAWRPLPGEPPAEQLRDIAAHVSHTVSILYLFVFCIIGAAAFFNLRRDRSTAGALTRQPASVCMLYLMLVIGVVPAIIATNLNGARADSFAKLGASFERARRLSEARAMYEDARRLQPAEETYGISLGRVLMEQARAAPHTVPEERAAYLRQAVAAVLGAQSDNPLNPLHTRNLARVHRLWASLAVDPAERSRHFDQSESYYGEAARHGPHNPALWTEWATLYLEWHLPVKALAKLDESLRLDTDADTYQLRANTYFELEAFEKALADYNRVLVINPKSAEAWSGKALALARLQRTAEAVVARREATALAPQGSQQAADLDSTK